MMHPSGIAVLKLKSMGRAAIEKVPQWMQVLPSLIAQRHGLAVV
jgi:hypothetical protein